MMQKNNLMLLSILLLVAGSAMGAAQNKNERSEKEKLALAKDGLWLLYLECKKLNLNLKPQVVKAEFEKVLDEWNEKYEDPESLKEALQLEKDPTLKADKGNAHYLIQHKKASISYEECCSKNQCDPYSYKACIPCDKEKEEVERVLKYVKPFFIERYCDELETYYSENPDPTTLSSEGHGKRRLADANEVIRWATVNVSGSKAG